MNDRIVRTTEASRHKRKWHCLAIALLVAAPWPIAPHAGAQEPETPCKNDLETRSVTLGIDNAGFADLRFTNARAPYHLVTGPQGQTAKKADKEDYRKCLGSAQLTLQNRVAGRSFIVQTSFVSEGSTSIKSNLPPAIDEIERALATARLRTDGIDNSTWELLERNLKGLRDLAEKDVDGDRLLEHLLEIRTECTSAGGACGALIGRIRAELDEPELTRVLDILKPPINKLDQMALNLANSIEALRAGEALGLRCTKREDGKQSCTLAIVLHGDARQVLAGDFWRAIVGAQKDQIELSVSFFDENGAPSNNKAYIASTPNPAEPPSQTQLKVVAGIGGSHRPAVDADPTDGVQERFSPIRPEGAERCGPAESKKADCGPYEGDQLRTFNGNGRLELAQTLGRAASASAIIEFKSGDLGNGKTKQDVTVNQYQIDVFGKEGAIFRFGQYAVASPSSSIAIKESGEGLEYFPGKLLGLSLAHLVKREGFEGFGTDSNEDSEVTILQARNVLRKAQRGIHGLSVTALYGEQENDPAEMSSYDYWTAGFDLSFGRSLSQTELFVGPKAEQREQSVRRLRQTSEILEEVKDLSNHLKLLKNTTLKERHQKKIEAWEDAVEQSQQRGEPAPPRPTPETMKDLLQSDLRVARDVNWLLLLLHRLEAAGVDKAEELREHLLQFENRSKTPKPSDLRKELIDVLQPEDDKDWYRTERVLIRNDFDERVDPMAKPTSDNPRLRRRMPNLGANWKSLDILGDTLHGLQDPNIKDFEGSLEDLQDDLEERSKKEKESFDKLANALASYSGSLAFYRSDRDVQTMPAAVATDPDTDMMDGDGSDSTGEDQPIFIPVANGEGSVGLFTSSWNWFKFTLVGDNFPKIEPVRTLTARLGYGTGDDPDTPEDEGYLGETASFSPDRLFLSGFASVLDFEDGSTVRAGLSNKLYGEISYSERTWPVLRHLLGKLGFEVEKEITTLRGHWYQFDQKLNGKRDAGYELGADLEITGPSGVKTTLSLAQFFPGDALEELFLDEEPFTARLQVSVTLK